MQAASLTSKPRIIAPASATNTPNCAAAPKSIVSGFAIIGPKSVIAPTPMKIIGGKISYLIPKPIAIMTFISSLKPVFGKFARMHPKAMGDNNNGSYSFTNAMYSRKQPTSIMMTLPMVRA